MSKIKASENDVKISPNSMTNLQNGIYTTARYNQKVVYIPFQDWIFGLYNETRRTLVYIPFWAETEYVNKVVHIPLLGSI